MSKQAFNGEILYNVDYEGYVINDWSKEIRSAAGRKLPLIVLPKIIVKILARMGDFIGKARGFPLNSFRYRNMTTHNLVDNIGIKEKVKNLPYTRKEATKKVTEFYLKNCQ